MNSKSENTHIDSSQSKAARVAGFTFIFAMAVVVFANYGINFRLIIPDNAAETAKNIMENETLFRLNIACNLIYVATVLVMLSSLYVILKPVNRNLALVAAFSRLIYALMWGIAALNTFGALRLLDDTAYLSVFGEDQLQTLARLRIYGSWEAYYAGLPFWGLASTLCSYLWFKSKYIPKGLAFFGIISSAWCVFCGFAYILFPGFGETVNLYLFDMPLVIFELSLGGLLLFKGIRIR